MGVVGMLMSILFRLQLSNPGESFAVLEWFLGEKWAPDGVLDPNMYLALVTIWNYLNLLGVDRGSNGNI